MTLNKESSAPMPLKAWAIVDIQSKCCRWTYRTVDGKKSGVAIYFNKPLIPKGWRKKKKVIRVSVVPWDFYAL